MRLKRDHVLGSFALIAALFVLFGALVLFRGIGQPGGPRTTQPPDAIGRDQAVRLASALAHSTAKMSVVSVEAGPFSRFSNGAVLKTVAGDPWAWSVVFEGSFLLPCASYVPSATASPCASVAVPRQRIILDARSGALLLALSGS